MPVLYEYWQHRATGDVWAVKLRDGEVLGAAEIGRQDVHEELLPYLSYRPTDASQLDKERDDFKRIDGRKGAVAAKSPYCRLALSGLDCRLGLPSKLNACQKQDSR
jgi:hypothetical protein